MENGASVSGGEVEDGDNNARVNPDWWTSFFPALFSV